jgi:hypothetical protein
MKQFIHSLHNIPSHIHNVLSCTSCYDDDKRVFCWMEEEVVVGIFYPYSCHVLNVGNFA